MHVPAIDVIRPGKSGQAGSASSYVRPVIDMSISVPGNFYLYLLSILNLCGIKVKAERCSSFFFCLFSSPVCTDLNTNVFGRTMVLQLNFLSSTMGKVFGCE